MFGENVFIIITILATALVVAIFTIIVLLTKKSHFTKSYTLMRSECNPIIYPSEFNEWESLATFNPAALMDDDGRIHIVYRAMGPDGLSRLGYAYSDDGINFTFRSTYPIYEPKRGYGLPDPKMVIGPMVYDPVAYASGGGWGGCEDPRMVLIEGKVYLSYTAFEGWNNAPIALSTIDLNDFKSGKWKWTRPILLSPENEMHKNWVIFPEKFDGKFAVLHGLSPKVSIEYVDDLDYHKSIKSSKSHGGGGWHDEGRKDKWDKVMKGAGPAPMRTELGWLILYHAVQPGSGYHVGAMILDEKDPSKVLYRSPTPILSPEMHYENNWKPGVVYATGAVIKNNNLFVYYGGGDRHVCVAQTDLKDFLRWIKRNGKV